MFLARTDRKWWDGERGTSKCRVHAVGAVVMVGIRGALELFDVGTSPQWIVHGRFARPWGACERGNCGCWDERSQSGDGILIQCHCRRSIGLWGQCGVVDACSIVCSIERGGRVQRCSVVWLAFCIGWMNSDSSMIARMSFSMSQRKPVRQSWNTARLWYQFQRLCGASRPWCIACNPSLAHNSAITLPLVSVWDLVHCTVMGMLPLCSRIKARFRRYGFCRYLQSIWEQWGSRIWFQIEVRQTLRVSPNLPEMSYKSFLVSSKIRGATVTLNYSKNSSYFLISMDQV